MERVEGGSYKPLEGKTILLGVTGSVALYKSIDLARELRRAGARVRVLMTPKASEMVSPMVFEWAVNDKVLTQPTGFVEHVSYAAEASLMIIAPATLNTLSKIAFGVTDNIVTLTAAAVLGCGGRLAVVPAMSYSLYNSPQARRVFRELESMSVAIIPPLIEEGKAKYPPLRDLAYIASTLAVRERDLRGRRILVTAGPTREHIDPVRVITNPSSGLMGVLVALEFASRGAIVTLVHGPMKHKPPYLTENYRVESTSEMASVIEKLTSNVEYDAAVFTAAPADYTPAEKAGSKIKSGVENLTIRLKPTKKTIQSVKLRPKVMVGFASETVADGEKLIEKALDKLEKYNLDMVIANIVGGAKAGFEAEHLDACIVTRSYRRYVGLIHKALIARIIADEVAKRLGGRS